MCSPMSPRSWKAAAGIGVLCLAWIGYAVSVQQPFFADGSHFFVKLLEERWFIYGEDFARHHAHYLTQSPIVFLTSALKVRNLDVLSWAFGLGLFLPYAVGLVASWLAVRRADLRWMIFPVLSLFAISANQAFVIVHESHVTTSLFWPLLLFVLVSDEYDALRAAVVLALALLFIRTYETVAVLGTVLVALQALRIRDAWGRASPLTRTVWVLLLAILLAGIAIAVRWTLFPRVPGNRSDLVRALPLVLRHEQFMLSLGYLAVILLLAVVPPLARSPWPYRLAVAVLVPLTAVVALAPVAAPDRMHPELHYHARGLILVMPAALAVLAVAVIRGWVTVPDVSWARMWTLVLLLAAGQTAWHVLAAGQWNGFRSVFKGELAAHHGVTPFEKTGLGRHREGIQLIRPFVWGWTQPTLSVVWAKDRAVDAMIVNPASAAVVWQPFDPLDPAQLPRLERYGFSYDRYVASLHRERAQARDGAR